MKNDSSHQSLLSGLRDLPGPPFASHFVPPPFHHRILSYQLAPTLSRAAKLRGVQIDVFKYRQGIIKTTVASACSALSVSGENFQ